MRSDLEDYSLENGYMVTKEFLEKQIPCTAIFAISDMLAIGAGKALSDAGYRVPEDISLTGFDGVEIGKYVIPSLTTLKQPIDSMARETARILFDIIGKKAKHQHCVFDGELVDPGFYDIEDVRKSHTVPMGTKGMLYGNTWF